MSMSAQPPKVVIRSPETSFYPSSPGALTAADVSSDLTHLPKLSTRENWSTYWQRQFGDAGRSLGAAVFGLLQSRDLHPEDGILDLSGLNRDKKDDDADAINFVFDRLQAGNASEQPILEKMRTQILARRDQLATLYAVPHNGQWVALDETGFPFTVTGETWQRVATSAMNQNPSAGAVRLVIDSTVYAGRDVDSLNPDRTGRMSGYNYAPAGMMLSGGVGVWGDTLKDVTLLPLSKLMRSGDGDHARSLVDFDTWIMVLAAVTVMAAALAGKRGGGGNVPLAFETGIRRPVTGGNFSMELPPEVLVELNAAAGTRGIRNPAVFMVGRAETGGRVSELELLKQAQAGEPAGQAWLDSVQRGLAGDSNHIDAVRSPLVQALRSLASHVIAPRADNFTPQSRTPWGGNVIAQYVKQALGIVDPATVVGESWEVSGHPSFPNRVSLTIGGQQVDVSVRILEKLFPEALYGRRPTGEAVEGMPYLVKLLNSGSWQESLEKLEPLVGSLKGLSYHEIHQRLSESKDPTVQKIHRDMIACNLSVQVHPPATDTNMKPGEHSKTEAWAIVSAEPGAGIYLGLKEGVTRSGFEDMLRQGQDVTSLLNFIEVKPGEVYFIPSGTMHAIGAGVLLLEPQETSETTYRVYDFGRTDAQGNPRQLHVDRAVAVTTWDGPRGEASIQSLRRTPQIVDNYPGTARVEKLLDEDVFALQRVTIEKDKSFVANSALGFKSYTVLEGTVTVREGSGTSTVFSKGQSFMVPQIVGVFSILNRNGSTAVVYETSSK